MMTPADLAILEERFTERYADETGRLYTGNDSNLIICELLKAYTPIDDFMNILKQKSRLIEMYGCNKFIFDKRAIRGFHQPSMEWYYLTWKVEMYRKFGLERHRKLFSNEPWFLKCIEAGRAEIRRKDPGSIVHTLDIKVCQSLEEAIRS
jgi:hypothetical protein